MSVLETVENEAEQAAVQAAMSLGAKIKISAIVVLIIGLVVLGWLYRREIQSAAGMAQQVLQQQATIDDMNHQLTDAIAKSEALEKVAAGRQIRIEHLQKQARGLENEIGKLKKRDPLVRAWADTAMPAAVYDRIRMRNAPDYHQN